MSDNLKNLTVGVSLDTGNFTNRMKVVNQQLKTLKSNYKSASKDSETFDKSFVGLTNRITNVKDQLTIYGVKLEATTKQLEEARAKHNDLEKEMKEAENVYLTSKQALDQLAKEGKKGTDEFNALEKTVKSNYAVFNRASNAYSANASSIVKLEREANELKGTMSSLEKEVVESTGKLNSLGKETESYSSKLSNLDNKLGVVEAKFGLLKAELGNNAKESKILKLENQELAEKYNLLKQKSELWEKQLDDTKLKLTSQTNALKQTKVAITETNYELVKAKTKYDENSAKVKELEQKLLNLKDKEMQLKNALKVTNTELDEHQKELYEAKTKMKEAENQATLLKAKIQGMGWGTASASLKKFSDTMYGIGGGLKSVGRSMSLYLTTPIIGLGVSVINTAREFEAGMSNVQAISGATGEDLEKLTEKARELGSKTSFSASEAAEGLSYMAL